MKVLFRAKRFDFGILRRGFSHFTARGFVWRGYIVGIVRFPEFGKRKLDLRDRIHR